MSTENPTPETCTCLNCGWQWERGQNGTHYCLDNVIKQRDEARAEAKEAETGRVEAVEAINKAFAELNGFKFETWLATPRDELLAHAVAALRAEVERLTKEHQAAIDTGVYSNDPQLRTEVAQRRKTMADIVRELGHGCCGLSHHEIAPEVKKVMSELATLRAQSQDNGVVVEAAAKDCSEELGHPLGVWDRDVVLLHMRALVATITNSQQKGGDQQCDPKTTTNQSPAIEAATSNAAPTSNPEGAATPAEDAKRLADRIVKHVENGIVYEVGASHVSIVRDVFEKWICEAIEHHAIQQATWHCETLAKLEATTPPNVTHAGMTQAREIALALYPKREDERQYPMFLAYRERAERTVASVLSRQTGPSVVEAAREIVILVLSSDSKRVAPKVESILTRLRVQDAEELRRHKFALKVARDMLDKANPSNLWDKARMYYDHPDMGASIREWHRILCDEYESALAAIDKELKP